MDENQKLLRFTRQTVATMSTIKRALDSLAGAAGGATGVGAISSLLGGASPNHWFLIGSAVVTSLSILSRGVLSYLVSITSITNPIRATEPPKSSNSPVN